MSDRRLGASEVSARRLGASEVSARKVVALLGIVLLVLTGCSRSVTGTPTALGPDPSDDQYRLLLQECKTVEEAKIAEVVGGATIDSEFIGAICRWAVDSGATTVTFDWFENGSLDVERSTNEKLGWQVTNVTVSSRRAIEIRQPQDPGSCGVTAGSPDYGVIGWWVQHRSGGPDPCAAALKLMELSLNTSA